jgi:hypothetical protein
MLVGPFFFPVFYQHINFVLILYLAVRSSVTFTWTLIGVVKAHRLLNSNDVRQRPIQSQQMAETKDGDTKLLSKTDIEIKEQGSSRQLYHAFIIPNYNEEEAIL